MANISLVAAVAKNGVIGKNNLMPWHLPEEMKVFRSLTLGKPVIVGRRTFESLPNFLADRHLIVLTRNEQYTTGTSLVQTATSIPQALKMAERFGDEIMIAGGELVYQQLLPLADRLYLSMLHDTYDGDAFFPGIKYSEWYPIQTTAYTNFSFVTFTHAYANANA